jgi:hypothetical protein
MMNSQLRRAQYLLYALMIGGIVGSNSSATAAKKAVPKKKPSVKITIPARSATSVASSATSTAAATIASTTTTPAPTSTVPLVVPPDAVTAMSRMGITLDDIKTLFEPNRILGFLAEDSVQIRADVSGNFRTSALNLSCDKGLPLAANLAQPGNSKALLGGYTTFFPTRVQGKFNTKKQVFGTCNITLDLSPARPDIEGVATALMTKMADNAA